MDQHLVDDDLKEQRRHQPEELQEERGDQYLAERRPVLLDRADKPADAETPRRVAERSAAGQQDQPAGPALGEIGADQQLGPRRTRIEHQHLVFPDPAEHQPAPVLQRGERWQRRRCQVLETGGVGPRLDRAPPRRAQQIGLVERPLAALMGYLGGVRREAEHLQCKGERRRPGIGSQWCGTGRDRLHGPPIPFVDQPSLDRGSSRRALGRSSFSGMQRRSEQGPGLLRLVGDIRAEPAAVGCYVEPGSDELAEQRDGSVRRARR